MFSKVKKYIKLPKQERNVLNQTFLWLIFSFFLVRLIPLRWFTSLLGEHNRAQAIKISNEELEIIKLSKRSIKRVKKILPWNVKCFDESITAKRVLRRYKVASTLYLGVNKKEDKLIAHAWLKVGEEFITGKEGHKNFKIVGYYT